MISELKFSVYIKPNASVTTFLGFDKERQSYIISIKEPAEGNKANQALLKFLKKLTGKNPKLVSGKTSRKKQIRLEES